MPLQNILDAILLVAFAVLGWFARELWSAVKELKVDLAKLREEIPQEYLSKGDWKTEIQRLYDLLNRIDQKLDKKVDR